MNTLRRSGSADPKLYVDLGALYVEPTCLFHNLAAAAGLDPLRDLRARDLRDMNFTGADLRGFDFRGSDLRGTFLRAAERLDATTQLADAQLDPEDPQWLRVQTPAIRDEDEGESEADRDNREPPQPIEDDVVLLFDDNLLREMEEMKLSVRTANCLRNAGVRHLGDLVQMSEYEVLRMIGLGQTSLTEN